MTREDILKRNPVDIWQMLAGIPSIRIADYQGQKLAMSTRTLVLDENSKPCYLLVAIDGRPQVTSQERPAFDLKELPAPPLIYGIEVFAGAATIPLQFAGIGDGKWCGLISVWTR
ncbi:MAG: hypothetical protein JWM95_4694 [Gemmatimonadetes bacterium]|nr:hypothetical protein [Gemmatimonadota bacterium]